MIKQIVIASTLKPVDDVRSYLKIAQSIAKTNKYEVNIIGNEGKKGNEYSGITFHPHKLRSTQWLRRIWICWKLFFKILRLKPHLLIITTYELIPTALLIKCFSGSKIIYDVQENHVANLQLRNKVIQLFAHPIRLVEWVGSLFIDAYWLAESCYQHELKLSPKKFKIVENKALDIGTLPSRKQQPIRALFSGTISEYAGAIPAIEIMILLDRMLDHFEGIMIGQIHNDTLLHHLKTKVGSNSNIQLITSKDPVPYDAILSEIKQANLGIISYQPNTVNKDKIPTKLYEYSRYQLPYLVQAQTKWAKIGEALGGAISIDFNQPDLDEIIPEIRKTIESPRKSYPKEATWEYEEDKVIGTINHLID
ncbi:MAG: hypothetical protein Tsb0034_23970 [Ekhidna sp.]